LRYNKPIWQLVAEVAESLNQETFTATDIIKKVHETNPQVPRYSISAYVIAMAPNHPSSIHYETTRLNHPYFYYLGNGRYRLLKQGKMPTTAEPLKPKSKLNEHKEFSLGNDREFVVSWTNDHLKELIDGRNNYGWNGKSPTGAINERNQVSKLIVLSCIRNSGGIDLDTINQVQAWGGLRHIKLENDNAIGITRDAFRF
jgi:hypothetical protein